VFSTTAQVPYARLGRQAQTLPLLRIPPRPDIGTMDKGCDFGRAPSVRAVAALRWVPASLGKHAAAPCGGGIEGQPLGLAYVDREQPPRDTSPLAASALTEAVKPVIGSLPDISGQIHKIAIGIAPLKALKAGNCCPHVSRIGLEGKREGGERLISTNQRNLWWIRPCGEAGMTRPRCRCRDTGTALLAPTPSPEIVPGKNGHSQFSTATIGFPDRPLR